MLAICFSVDEEDDDDDETEGEVKASTTGSRAELQQAAPATAVGLPANQQPPVSPVPSAQPPLKASETMLPGASQTKNPAPSPSSQATPPLPLPTAGPASQVHTLHQLYVFNTPAGINPAIFFFFFSPISRASRRTKTDPNTCSPSAGSTRSEATRTGPGLDRLSLFTEN